jgi:hypothetical protein
MQRMRHKSKWGIKNQEPGIRKQQPGLKMAPVLTKADKS